MFVCFSQSIFSLAYNLTPRLDINSDLPSVDDSSFFQSDVERREKVSHVFYRKCEIGVFHVLELFERENNFVWPAVLRKDSLRVLFSSERFRTEKFSKASLSYFVKLQFSWYLISSHSLTYCFFTLILGKTFWCFLIKQFLPTGNNSSCIVYLLAHLVISDSPSSALFLSLSVRWSPRLGPTISFGWRAMRQQYCDLNVFRRWLVFLGSFVFLTI